MATGHRRSGRSWVRLGGAASLVVAAGVATLACKSAEDVAAGADGGGSITVSAASSLRGAFAELGPVFEEAQGVEVTFNFDSSSSLARQILDGAPADVYASAAPPDMEQIREAGLARSPDAFAGNALTIVTRPGNPEGIDSLADLADVGIVSLCGLDVPCGRYAEQALGAAGIAIPEARTSRGQNVAATLTAVAEGDAVAGIVYVSDASSAGDAVDAVPIGDAEQPTVTYSIAVLDSTPRPAPARAFVELVLGDAGQSVLREHGFLLAP